MRQLQIILFSMTYFLFEMGMTAIDDNNSKELSKINLIIAAISLVLSILAITGPTNIIEVLLKNLSLVFSREYALWTQYLWN